LILNFIKKNSSLQQNGYIAFLGNDDKQFIFNQFLTIHKKRVQL